MYFQLNRALREAYRFMPLKEDPEEKTNEEKPQVDLKTMSIPTEEKPLPRKFSKSTARFEVPMNLKLLKGKFQLYY